MSSLIGASLANREKLYFGVIGDLSFFYDMNSLGNRHIGNNLRILLINNGRGTEFTNKDNFTYQAGIEAKAVSYISADGHFGQKSKQLVKHYAEDLGFNYLSASNKKEFLENLDIFASSKIEEKPVLFEVFTNSEDEREALEFIYHLKGSSTMKMKQVAKKMLGKKGTTFVKKMLNK